MTKLSIIVPIYNVEKYLKECVDSILNQTLKDIEILLIDDASPDNCPQICDEYALKDNRVRVIHKKNGGYGHSCNVGLDNVSSEYIAIVEPDDYIAKEMYEDLYKIAKENDSDIVKSNFYNYFDLNNRSKLEKEKFDSVIIPQDKSFTIKECPLFLYYHPSVWSCIYKKEFIKKNNIRFVEAPGAGWTDNPFQVQTMCLAERINYVDKTYYYWRRINEEACDDLKDFTIPFKRSDEIHKWLEENNITDKNILCCLYMRELSYIDIALKCIKQDKFKELQPLVDAMMERIDFNLLKSNKYTPKKSIKQYKKFKNKLYLTFIKNKFDRFRKNIISINYNSKRKRIKLFGLTLLDK